MSASRSASRCGPIALVIAAVAALGVGVYELIKHWTEVKEFFYNLWVEYLEPMFGDTIRDIQKTLREWYQEALAFTKETWPQIKEIIVEVWRYLGPIISAALALWSGQIKTAFTLIGTITRVAWAQFKAVIETTFAVVGFYIKQALDTIATAIRIFTKILNGDWKGAWDEVVGYASRTRERLQQLFSKLAEIAMNAGKEIFRAIGRGIEKAAHYPVDAAKKALAHLRDLLPGSEPKEGPLVGLMRRGAEIMNLIAQGITSAWRKVRDAMAGAFGGGTGGAVEGGAVAAFLRIEDVGRAVFERLGDVLSDFFGKFVRGTASVKDAWNALLDIVANVIGQIISAGATKWLGGALGVPAMASGGIVSRPTLALLGERGPEAVVPLGGLAMAGAGVVNITIQALDPVAFMGWAQRNRGAIADALLGARAGNRPSARGRRG